MTKLWMIVIGIIIIAVLLSIAFYKFTQEEVTVNVIKTERINTSNGKDSGSKYMVYTEEETFQNTDCLWAGKFNSSDVHGMLSKPGNYTLLVYGWRIPFFSQYRDIIRVISFNGE